MKIVKHKKYFFLTLSKDELEELNKYVDWEELDIELHDESDRENTLTLKGLFGIYKYLKPLQHHNKTTFVITDKLEKLIDVFIDDYLE